jgi:hypothetical protein
MTDTTRRDALARSLAARLLALEVDELRVIDVIVARISGGGRDQYGALVVATDARDFRKEAADEFADALWYMAAEVVRRADERAERLACEAADEHVTDKTRRLEEGLRELRESSIERPRPAALDIDFGEHE